MKLHYADELKPYPEIAESGLPWIGQVPAHWAVLPLCAVATPKSIVGQQHRELLSVYLDRGVIRFSDVEEKRTNVTSEDLTKYQAVDPGDFVLNNQQAWRGSVGVSNISGIVSPAYLVFSLTPRLNTGFANLLFREQAMVSQYRICSRGVGSIQRNLYWPQLKRVVFPAPPLAEQHAIVRFLDHADRRIQRYIRAKQKLVALLEEQKQTIIHHAVTGQIDVRTGQPYPAYKDSGVEWMREVPEDWEVVPLRRVTLDSCDGPFGTGLKSSHYTEQGIRVVRLQNIGHAEFKDSDAAFISPRYYSSLGEHSVISGDVLIAGLGDNNNPAGRACVAPENIIPAMVKADCFRFRLNRARIQPRFAALQLTATATVVTALLSTGATRQRTNLQATSGRSIGIPSVPEQNLIVQYITAEVSGIERTKVAIQREIELLREYRTRLITDVVTGKLDVRDAAAELPEDDVTGDDDESTEEYTIAKYVTG